MAPHSSMEEGDRDEDEHKAESGDEDEHKGRGEEKAYEDYGHDLVEESIPLVMHRNPTRTRQPLTCGTYLA
ncbi:hypothetical protein PVK06_005203 [Gossypium arboreum]|uniref:Uncharacterized protein n=1 Tax=Gossypium arboreum TaxID=29729 RepID=A0ABR0QVB1_GOSAR|nr:hypothetical protein PVK06_005203 [Gossypium arboreum]